MSVSPKMRINSSIIKNLKPVDSIRPEVEANALKSKENKEEVQNKHFERLDEAYSIALNSVLAAADECISKMKEDGKTRDRMRMPTKNIKTKDNIEFTWDTFHYGFHKNVDKRKKQPQRPWQMRDTDVFDNVLKRELPFRMVQRILMRYGYWVRDESQPTTPTGEFRSNGTFVYIYFNEPKPLEQKTWHGLDTFPKPNPEIDAIVDEITKKQSDDDQEEEAAPEKSKLSAEPKQADHVPLDQQEPIA